MTARPRPNTRSRGGVGPRVAALPGGPLRPVGLLLTLAACAPPPLPVVDEEPWQAWAGNCDAPDLAAPERFGACSTGSGLFGEWFVAGDGLPAYRYRFDQHADERARWFNTEKLDRRDHWFALGNHRVNVMVTNDGLVQVATQDRGVTLWNAYDEAKRNYSGGFGWLDDGEATWSTAYRWRPVPSRTRREVGVGWALLEVEHRGVRATRRVFAPPGGDAVVLAEVTLANTSQRDRALRHHEYWDVARRDVEINWLVSGDPFSSLPVDARAKRDALNSSFREQAAWDAAARALVVRRTLADGVQRPPRGTADPKDWYPDDPYLAVLEGDAHALYVDQAAFFGDGGPEAPVAVTGRAPGEALTEGPHGRAGTANTQPRLLVLRSDVTLRPGETKTLRFAYGVVPHGEPVSLGPAWATATPADAARAVEPALLRFAAPSAPFLQRELAWHSAQLEASVGRREYFGQRVVPQGSAYLYLHGADGAARDLGLFALPLVFTNPALARDELRLYMKVTHGADRRFSYAFQGHGMLDDALGLHRAPSDLPLFFLWALCEYVEATGDTSLLDEAVPYWPSESVPGATGWTHARDAARHLLDVVGTGPHGLLRVGTGDWSDGIVVEAPDRDLAIAQGESVPNSEMALEVLPRAAALIEPRDAALAAELRAAVPGLRAAVQATWTGQQFGRAYFGDGVLVRGAVPDLEAQVWPLVSGDGFAAPADRATLVETVRSRLDAPSPTGAMLRERGEVWPAISALLTWGYARSGRMDLAWEHLGRNTLHAHALAFPGQWAGLWSAPDGLASSFGPRPGEAWFSPATPMTDFPVQNNNAHAMPVFAALKACGVEAVSGGLRLAPGQTARPWSFRTALLDASWDGATLEATYRKVGAGPRSLELSLPGAVTGATQDGAAVTVAPGATGVKVTVSGGASTVRATTR